MSKLSNQPARLRCGQSFFGVQFDFHAGADCTGIGRTLRPATLDKMLREIAPDYV
ncbi:MAG: hypothetical protein WCH98_10595 [Verrucomicrobiota bacterium]